MSSTTLIVHCFNVFTYKTNPMKTEKNHRGPLEMCPRGPPHLGNTGYDSVRSRDDAMLLDI